MGNDLVEVQSPLPGDDSTGMLKENKNGNPYFTSDTYGITVNIHRRAEQFLESVETPDGETALEALTHDEADENDDAETLEESDDSLDFIDQ